MSSASSARVLLLVLALFLADLVRGSAQGVNPPNGQAIFDPIQKETRDAFTGRMRSVVRYQGAHDWAQLYELLALPDPKSKAEFVAVGKKYDRPDASFVLEFHPDSLKNLTTVPEQKYEWIMSGCAKYRIGNQIQYSHSSMYALFRDGNWYFSEVMINMRCGNDPDPCQQQKIPAARR